MNVNFTGMQNVGSYHMNNRVTEGDEEGRIAIQLNNDGENDLDDFKQVLEKRPDLAKSGVLDIVLITTPNKRNPACPYNDVYLNSKKLEINDENLPVFSKINNLLKRISKGEEKMPVSKEYLQTEGYDRFYSEMLQGRSPEEQAEYLNTAHYLPKVRLGADVISKKLVKALDNFCMSDPKQIFSGVKYVGGFSYSEPDKTMNRLQLALNDEDKSTFKDMFLRGYTGYISEFINVDLVTAGEAGETALVVNGKKLEVNEENIPVFKKLAQLMSNISKTDDELPFPKNYLTSSSLNTISFGFSKPGSLENLSKISGDEKEASGIEVDIVKTDKDVKYIAKKVLNNIDKQMDSYFE